MIASGAIALMSAGTASAGCGGVYDEALPITASSPADGAFIAPSASLPVKFMLATPVQHLQLWVRVTSQNTLGQNGTLSDLHGIDDFFALGESMTDPGNYSGASNKAPSWWTNVPGTYYWQMFAMGYDATYTSCHAYASPVYTLTVGAPPPPPATTPPPSAPSTPQLPFMTGSTGRAYAYETVSGVFHHRHGYRASCTPRSDVRISCNVRFSSGPTDYWGTVTVYYLFGAGRTVPWDPTVQWNNTYMIHSINDRCYQSGHPSRCRITTRSGSW
jgi:hypothetical protein